MELKISPLRICFTGGWIVICLLVLGAPFLASQAHYGLSSVIYLLFSRICHQIPERSFAIAGFPFAICHRCFGIYLGLAAGSLLKMHFETADRRRHMVLLGVLPVLVDGSLSFFGLWDGFPVCRFLTGLLFGTVLSSLLIRGIEDLRVRPQLQRLSLHSNGGVK